MDAITKHLNDCVRNAFLKIKEEQSTPEGLKAREDRINLWKLQNSIYIGELKAAEKIEADKYLFKRYKG